MQNFPLITQKLEEESLNKTSGEHNENSFLVKFFEICKTELGEETFDKWLVELEIFSQSTSEIIFSAPSKFVRDWINREFIQPKTLVKIAQKISPQIHKISAIYVAKTPVQNLEITNSPNSDSSKQVFSENKITNLSKYNNIFAFATELNPRFTFQNFINVKYNKLASSMAKIAAGIDKQINLFDDKIPLFIHGGVGMGKTHLAQAIAWQIKEFDQSKKVVYLSAEKFMYHFVQSIRSNDVMSFKEKMRSIDVLIVDDVQFIAGKESTQQEFMNCFNYLVEENKQVVLVCDRCPSDLEKIDEKLKSRIAGGMIVSFKNPDFTDRLTIVKEKSQTLGQEICEKVLNFIAEKITTSVRDLEGALKKLIAEKVLAGTEISLENAKTILASYVRSSGSVGATVEKIQKIVAEFYDIKIADLLSKKRAREIARARQIAMFLAKNLTSESLPKIGEKFGGKNHATVIHSVKIIQKLINSNQTTAQEIKILEEKLR